MQFKILLSVIPRNSNRPIRLSCILKEGCKINSYTKNLRMKQPSENQQQKTPRSKIS